MKVLRNYLFLFIFITTACSEVEIKTANGFELVKLPDSTYVFLNKNSSLTYNENFNDRQVKLEGEAFFDVTKGEDPFIVKTSLSEITVLGTTFSVRSTDNDLKVQVKKGTVEVKAKDQVEKLQPGQQVSIANNKLKKSKADLDYEVWLSAMHIELHKLGKEFRRGAKAFRKDSRRIGNALKKEAQKLKKDLK
ncbi:MAG: FecR family protein [Candidatus Cyclobacteriaceae bacterium M2_1C_046]